MGDELGDELNKPVLFAPEDRPTLDAQPCGAISIGFMGDGQPSILMMVGKTDRYFWGADPETMREFARELIVLADEAEEGMKP